MLKEKKMNRLFAALTVMIMVAVLGFSFPGETGAAAASHKSVSNSNTDLAIDLYLELGKDPGNLFFSPLQHLLRACNDICRRPRGHSRR